MTSKLTRERIELIANFHRAMTLPPSHDEIEELAHMALAALDSEPVAWTSEEAIAEVYCDETGMIGPKHMVGDIPLYRHAQPAPVMPDEKPMPNPLSMYAVDAVAAIAEVKGWNACRAAMLNHPSSIQPNTDAAPGAEIKHPSSNSPVIPDGYVMVPKEATLDMLKAGAKQEMKGEAFQYVWQAMLAAAPQGEPDGK